MTRARDLGRLIEAVEAGDDLVVATAASDIASAERNIGQYFPTYDILKAFRGDMNAALALLAELLPEWAFSVVGYDYDDGGKDEANVWPAGYHDEKSALGMSDTPARALLLATLKAYRTVQEGAR